MFVYFYVANEREIESASEQASSRLLGMLFAAWQSASVTGPCACTLSVRPDTYANIPVPSGFLFISFVRFPASALVPKFISEVPKAVLFWPFFTKTLTLASPVLFTYHSGCKTNYYVVGKHDH